MMRADKIIISGNRWRVGIVIIAACYAVAMLVYLFFFFHSQIKDILLALIVITIGLLPLLLSERLLQYDIAISSHYVEGPMRKGPLMRRRRIPLHDIDIRGGKTPTFTKNGYIRTHNNQRIILMGLYFSPSQGKTIFKEIKKRLAK